MGWLSSSNSVHQMDCSKRWSKRKGEMLCDEEQGEGGSRTILSSRSELSAWLSHPAPELPVDKMPPLTTCLFTPSPTPCLFGLCGRDESGCASRCGASGQPRQWGSSAAWPLPALAIPPPMVPSGYVCSYGCGTTWFRLNLAQQKHCFCLEGCGEVELEWVITFSHISSACHCSCIYTAIGTSKNLILSNLIF